jgi:hypothetical protein
VYLAPLPSSFAGELIRLLAGQVESIVSASPVELDPDGDEAEQRIKSDTTIPVTVRVQLINARVGQGLFRSRVEMIESDCRVTGVSDRRFLRASHGQKVTAMKSSMAAMACFSLRTLTICLTRGSLVLRMMAALSSVRLCRLQFKAHGIYMRLFHPGPCLNCRLPTWLITAQMCF